MSGTRAASTRIVDARFRAAIKRSGHQAAYTVAVPASTPIGKTVDEAIKIPDDEFAADS